MSFLVSNQHSKYTREIERAMISPVGHIALEAIIIVTSLGILGLRIYMNLRIPGRKHKALMVSDWLLVAAQAMGGPMLAYQIWGNLYVMKHQDPAFLLSEGALKGTFAGATIYITVLWIVKASFIAFYWSLHAHLTMTLKRLLYFAAAYLSATFVSMHMINFLWCRPFSSMFKFTTKGFCNIATNFTTGTILYCLNVSTDMIVMLIGLMFVYNLRRSLGPRQWMAAAFVFTVGSIPIIASTVRYSLVYYILRDPSSSFRHFADIEAWSEIDVAFVLYAACLPALRNLIREKRDRGAGPSHSTGRSEPGSILGRFRRRRSERGGNVIWLGERELTGSLSEDVEKGKSGSGEAFDLSAIAAPKKRAGLRASVGLDTIISCDFDDEPSHELGLRAPPAAMLKARQNGHDGWEEEYNQQHALPRNHSPDPIHPVQQKPPQHEREAVVGCELELRDLGSVHLGNGTLSPAASLTSEPSSEAPSKFDAATHREQRKDSIVDQTNGSGMESLLVTEGPKNQRKSWFGARKK